MTVGMPGAAVSVAAVDDCWNTIGVRGDKTCARLPEHIHCRNCPVYAAAAAVCLDRDLPDGYLAEWTEHFARPKPAPCTDENSVVVFRIGGEWLALPTGIFREVAELRPIHSLPHRRNRLVLGIASVRGLPVLCVSLAEALGLEPASDVAGQSVRLAQRRLMVVGAGTNPLAFIVDEVQGVHRFKAEDLGPVPATVGKAAASYTRNVVRWRDRAVGCLNDVRLFHTLTRSLA